MMNVQGLMKQAQMMQKKMQEEQQRLESEEFEGVSGGGMVLTFIFSITLFKEKMTKAQTAGFFVGVASIVLLNL